MIPLISYNEYAHVSLEIHGEGWSNLATDYIRFLLHKMATRNRGVVDTAQDDILKVLIFKQMGF